MCGGFPCSHRHLSFVICILLYVCQVKGMQNIKWSHTYLFVIIFFSAPIYYAQYYKITSALVLFHLISKALTTSSNARNACLFLKKKAVRWPFVQQIHLSDLEHIKLRRDWVCQVFFSSHNLKSRGFVILVGAFILLLAFT